MKFLHTLLKQRNMPNQIILLTLVLFLSTILPMRNNFLVLKTAEATTPLPQEVILKSISKAKLASVLKDLGESDELELDEQNIELNFVRGSGYLEGSYQYESYTLLLLDHSENAECEKNYVFAGFYDFGRKGFKLIGTSLFRFC